MSTLPNHERANLSKYLSKSPVYKDFLHVHLKMHREYLDAELQSRPDVFETSSMKALKVKVAELLVPLKQLDFKLSVFDIKKAQEMFNALDELYGLINDLKYKEKVQADLAARPRKMTAKAKAAARKRAQAKRSTPKVSQAPQKEVKLDAVTTAKLSAVEKVISTYVDEQKAYLAKVEAFLIENTGNHDRAVLQALFDPKAKFKSILDLKEMKNIVTHLQEKLFPAQPHKAWDVLGGANGVKFRVGDVINTVHNSSAEKGHKGHGGCVDGYRDFLIRVYEQAEKVAT